ATSGAQRSRPLLRRRVEALAGRRDGDGDAAGLQDAAEEGQVQVEEGDARVEDVGRGEADVEALHHLARVPLEGEAVRAARDVDAVRAVLADRLEVEADQRAVGGRVDRRRA